MPRTIRGMLLFLLLIMVVPGVLAQGGVYYIRLQEQRSHDLQGNLELARSVAESFDAFVEHVLHVEMAIGLALTSIPSATVEQMNEILLANTVEIPSVQHFWWADPRGRVIASSEPGAVGMDIGGRPYFFDFETASSGPDWAASDLFISSYNGAPAFVIARGIRDSAGAPRGVVLAVVSPERLDEVVSVRRAGQGAIAITDRQGRLVYRYPSVSQSWEQRSTLASDPLVVRALNGEEVTGIITQAGTARRMAGFVPIGSLGWAASATRPQAEVLAPVFEDLVRESGLAIVVAVLAFALALAFSRYLTAPLGILRDHALAIGRGDIGQLVRVAGPVELEQVADAFNRMGIEIRAHEETREQYITELNQVSDALRHARDDLEKRVEERTAELATANDELLVEICERKVAEDSLRETVDKLRRTLHGTIHGMAQVVEVRDPYTSGHQQHVAALACAIAKEMGLTEDQVESIQMAGLVHDIGKIGIPAEILSKPGRLSAMEFNLIKAHPQIGFDILKNIDFPWPVAQMVLEHHERLDGSGYPAGISGQDILLEARILAVADVVEAIASHRPYRAALGTEQALEQISLNTGTLFDPCVVSACLKLIVEQRFKFD